MYCQKGKLSLMSTKGGVWYWCSDWQWVYHGTAPLCCLPCCHPQLPPSSLGEHLYFCCSL